MSRSVPEWIGKDDDTAIPDRVRLRVFEAKGGRCHLCGRLIRAGERWVLEHVIALVNWLKTALAPHGNRESNLALTCCNCIAPKNAADVAEKSKVAKKRQKHLGISKPSRMAGSRNSKFKKKMDGSVVLRWAKARTEIRSRK